MYGSVEVAQSQPITRELVGRALLWLTAFGAAGAAVTALVGAADADAASTVLQVWRGYGLVVFAGLFCVLAVEPRRCPGLWELVLLNKLALALTGAVLLADDVPDAALLALGDGVLCVVLAVAYVCCRGWTAWTTPSVPLGG